MAKLDIVLERIRKLPADRQEAMVVQIDFLLDQEGADSLLTDEQWEEVDAALADPNEATIDHDTLMAQLRATK